MHLSHHAEQRLNQRGIPRRLVDFALRHGRVEGHNTLITAYNLRFRANDRGHRHD